MPTPISTADSKKVVNLGKKQPIDEGSYGLAFDVDFTVDNVRTFNASGGDDMTFTQSIMVDNLASDKKLLVRFRTISDNFELAIPPKSSACLPAFVDSNSNIEFESQFAGSISVILCSLPFPPYVFSPDGLSVDNQDAVDSQLETIANINIASGQQTSQIIAREARNLTGFLIDAATSGIITIHGSIDGSNFYPLRSSTGEAATYDTTLGSGIYYIDNIQETQPATHFRFVSDTAEAAQRNITPILEQLIKG